MCQFFRISKSEVHLELLGCGDSQLVFSNTSDCFPFTA